MLYGLCGVRKYNLLNCGHRSNEVIKVLNQLGQTYQNLSRTRYMKETIFFSWQMWGVLSLSSADHMKA